MFSSWYFSGYKTILIFQIKWVLLIYWRKTRLPLTHPLRRQDQFFGSITQMIFVTYWEGKIIALFFGSRRSHRTIMWKGNQPSIIILASSLEMAGPCLFVCVNITVQHFEQDIVLVLRKCQWNSQKVLVCQMAMMGFENFERMHPELLKTSSWADIGWHLRILLRCRPLPIKQYWVPTGAPILKWKMKG